MTTMKRRVIYATDEQWADLQAQARGERTTISNLIRHGMALIPSTGLADESPVEFRHRTAAAIRDKDLHVTVPISTPVFNRRPFTPAPKKGK